MSQDLKVLGKIELILSEFSRGLSRPEQKFLRDLVFGILCSQSSLLSKIARAVAEPEEVKVVYDRLDINLGRYDLSRPYQRAQSEILKRVDETFLFIFDPSEIVKPFALKMEGLSLVRDASDKPKKIKTANGKFVNVQPLKPGYPLRVAIAMSPVGDILPVELSLYSYASEFFISQNDETLQALETLIHKTNFLPTLILDREFDSYSIIRHLGQLRQRFVIRLKKNRKYRIPGEPRKNKGDTYTREEMANKYAFLSSKEFITYSKKGKVKTHLFEFRAAYVELLSEQKNADTIRDVGDTQALTLIQMRIKKETGNPVLYLLTNSRPKSPEDLSRVARSYLARWNVEEYIRFIKQHFSIEDFLVRDLGRMKNLIWATYIATVIIHLLTDRKSNFGFKNHHHLLMQSLPVNSPKKSRDFFLYSYGRGLSNIVSLNKKLLAPAQVGAKSSEKDPQLKLQIGLT
jgi:Transposase DDE domain